MEGTGLSSAQHGMAYTASTITKVNYISFTRAKAPHSKLSFLLRYHTAISNRGLVALTTPYMDAGGAGVVITAAHTLYYGKADHVHRANDQVMGVMGADFSLSYFHSEKDMQASCMPGTTSDEASYCTSL
ncbi:hypothetical protein OS493_031711 [Desmophyllum pertusum]|uniref:Uncharacterized protein n=1 Tax=Desmophyllum pertusum TaxID=174260 RepID=A0A9X0D128_9CNID|nr:hypothetical protein OS493_031711 [Desmophyllum pertusum]